MIIGERRMKFYRYSDIVAYYDYKYSVPKVIITEEVFYLVRETKCGYWISRNPNYDENNIELWGERKRWVSKYSTKRLAYPTREEALQSFKARKKRQITILTAQLQQAQIALEKATNNPEEIRKDRRLWGFLLSEA
jgi:hypothetical protein